MARVIDRIVVHTGRIDTFHVHIVVVRFLRFLRPRTILVVAVSSTISSQTLFVRDGNRARGRERKEIDRRMLCIEPVHVKCDVSRLYDESGALETFCEL